MSSLLEIYYQSALDLKLPVRYFSASNCLEILLGNTSYFFIGRMVPLNFCSCYLLAQDKNTVHFLLKEAEIYNSESFYVDKDELPQREDLREYSVLMLKKRIIGIVEHVEVKGKRFVVSRDRKMNHENAIILEEIASVLNLDWLCLTIVCAEIDSPFYNQEWYITEMNTSPDITLYEQPDKGNKINVSRKLLKHLIHRHLFAYTYHRLAHYFSLEH